MIICFVFANSIRMFFVTTIIFVSFLQISLYLCDDSSLANSNCSLNFYVQTAFNSTTIDTEFPLELIAYYNLTCNVPDLTGYYKVMPLSILIVGKYNYENESTKTMIELDSNQFDLNITQSSTIQLCVFEKGDDDDQHRICRQIHVGISYLYRFWNFPMKFVYLFSFPSLICYYLFRGLRGKWRKSGKKSHKLQVKPVQRASFGETKHDTFENEKVFDRESSDEEEKEEDDEQEVQNEEEEDAL